MSITCTEEVLQYASAACRVAGRDLDQVVIWTTKFENFHSTYAYTTMPAPKSQKRAEADKRIEKALNEPSRGQFQSICEAAWANDVPHNTLLRRVDDGKSTAESSEPQQILTIPDENALAECITRLAIVEHPPKHAFIRELVEEIRSNRLNVRTIHHQKSTFKFQSAIPGCSASYIDIPS